MGSRRSPLPALLAELCRVLKPGGSLVWTTPVHSVNFFRVFLASWREILDVTRPRNLLYGPAILRYALSIQQRGKRGEYTFWSEHECARQMVAAGFDAVRTTRSFARQAIVVAGKKRAGN